MAGASSPLRVGFLFEYPTLNGGEFSLLAVLRELQGASIAPVALAPPAGPLSAAFAECGIRHLPLTREQMTVPDWHHELNQVIRDFDLQLLHANSLSMGRKLGAVSPQLECPTTCHLRDIIKLSSAAVTALNAHAGMIAVSQATKSFHAQQGLSSERQQVIYNGIALEQFQPRPRTGWLHRELDLPADALLAGTVGQICLRKGQNDLAQAAVLLRDRLPRLHFLLIGERHSSKSESVAFDAEITQVLRDAGMEHQLHRLGQRSDVDQIYPELDVLIHPARQEPLGRVLLEGAACGVPIVATDVGGTPEILTHDESAWLTPASDPAALAAGVEAVLSESNRSSLFSQQARQTIVDRFSISRSAHQHLQFWNDVIAGSAPPLRPGGL
ncbi:glycosyltransferase family 4 protein [Planctomicrobium piriforme]|uniref:Glycosyltransferase Family 4 n=1 Tax=Planctomicrobium piriforme TaxID=1576369 RepID=A0A1I3F6Q7_9PLAN|nr:glycosyltransferase family 4 protein [Planctomicrobium piriforme]SFI06904.1 Glycosyltransferase Family 4 [Planctomicrobium piriforme]